MPTIFRAPSNFDSFVLPSLLADIDALVETPGEVTIDLADVNAIDGAGVGALATLFKRRSIAGRQFSVANARGPVRDLLAACGLLAVLPKVADVQSAARGQSASKYAGVTAATVIEPANYAAAGEAGSGARRDAA